MVDKIVNELPCNFFIPNSFSPNGDGINDEFRIYGPDPGIAVITRYAIFDRWGNMLYEQKNLVMDTQEKVWWDGTFRDKPVDNGVVVYYIEFSFTNGNKRIYKGDLQIIR